MGVAMAEKKMRVKVAVPWHLPKTAEEKGNSSSEYFNNLFI